MKKTILLALFILAFLAIIINQIIQKDKQEISISKLKNEANNFYSSKKYEQATTKYLKVLELSDFESQKQSAAYNAACCLALQKKTDSAFIILKEAITYGYKNKKHLTLDSDLKILHNNSKWNDLINRIPKSKKLNEDPELAKIITKDIHHFWEAYDASIKNSNNARKIYKEYYFDKASDGMKDYAGSKISSINYFIEHIQTHPKLYNTIRENTLKVDDYRKEIQQSFKNFKALYKEAKFPDVYFVIGAFTSGGTVSPAGLLIGTNQMSDGKNVNTEELNFREKMLMNKSKFLPHVVAHELIHFQQNEIKRDTITLGYAINEGMADFLGELISGDTANRKIFDWTKGKEKQIWANFKKDMYFNRYSNWIANSGTASKDSYPDLGYWIGYEICKSYYENFKDKKQAIYNMLHIQDYRKFLKESKWEVKLEKI
jgi:hypothetical protein